jgi:hypothetical protein
MTGHPTPSSATSHTTSEDLITQACVHIDAAVHQVAAAADSDIFSPLLGLAGLLSLIRGGLDPSIRAAHDPNDSLLPMDHVDRAMSLLDGVPPSAGPADLLVWSLRLQDVRNTVMAAVMAQR